LAQCFAVEVSEYAANADTDKCPTFQYEKLDRRFSSAVPGANILRGEGANEPGELALRLYLHIGIGKTGTSAIQRTLDQNYHCLLSQGVLYPLSGREGQAAHHWLAPFGAPELGPTEEALYDALDAELDASPASVAILSSEQFCYCTPGVVEGVARRFDKHDVKIIFFVRRQTELVPSAFIQKVRSGEAAAGDIEGYYEQALADRSFFFNDRLDPWTRYFGRRSVIVRLYDPLFMQNGDSVSDFLHAIGLAGLTAGDGPVRENAGIGGQFLPLIEAFDMLAGESAARDAFLQSLSLASQEVPAAPIIDDSFASRIVQDHRADNEQFARNYLSRDRARAFLSPPASRQSALDGAIERARLGRARAR
jgi:hypothetical protein